MHDKQNHRTTLAFCLFLSLAAAGTSDASDRGAVFADAQWIAPAADAHGEPAPPLFRKEVFSKEGLGGFSACDTSFIALCRTIQSGATGG